MYDYYSHERFHDPRREQEESDEWAEDIASRKEYLQQRAQKMREKENLKNENQAPSTETIHETDQEEEFEEVEEEAAEGFGRSSIKKQKRKIRFSRGGNDELTAEQKKLFRRFGIKPKQLTAFDVKDWIDIICTTERPNSTDYKGLDGHFDDIAFLQYYVCVDILYWVETSSLIEKSKKENIAGYFHRYRKIYESEQGQNDTRFISGHWISINKLKELNRSFSDQEIY